MPNTQNLDDDEYVAKLLADDARQSSIRYSTMGMSALMPKRPTNAAPKPNTRFLKTLVREADSHNAALKKKEELEARIRLRNIREKDSSGRLGRPQDDERAKKRRRLSDDHERSRSSRHKHSRRTERNSSSERSRSPERRRREIQHYRNREAGREERRSHHHRSSKRDRSRSHERRERGTARARKDDSIRADRHRSDRMTKPRHPEDSPPRTQEDRTRSSRSRSSSSASSDPLASIIGPKPPGRSASVTRKRGRGFQNPGPSSNIDEHFSSSYNPTQDTAATMEMASDDSDWDNALEAFRDRQAWRAKQLERMREAGFGDEEIQRWEKTATRSTRMGGASDGDVRDVKWRKRGEVKEWDRGKVDTEDVDDGEEDSRQARPLGASTSAPATTGHAERASRSKPRPSKASADLDVWRRKDSGFMKQFRNALG